MRILVCHDETLMFISHDCSPTHNVRHLNSADASSDDPRVYSNGILQGAATPASFANELGELVLDRSEDG
jgi:hypothetical protein